MDEQEDRGFIGDMGDLTNQQVGEVEKILEYLSTMVEAESMEHIAMLLIGTEFRTAQAKADGWAFYQSMKMRDARVQGVRLRAAQEEGHLDGRNAEERKRNESFCKDTDSEILAAKGDTIAARAMSDCLSNAHASVREALTLVMGMVQHENAD